MDWLEQELKHSLARQAPPEAFAEEVADRVEDKRAQSRALPRWLAAAAAIALAVSGAAAYRYHEGMAAKRQVMEAFAIAGGKLNHLQRHLKEASQ